MFLTWVKARPQHRELRLYFYVECVGSLTSHRVEIRENSETGPQLYNPLKNHKKIVQPVTHGSYMFANFLFKEFSRTFPGILNNTQAGRFSRRSLNCVPIILHILHMKKNRMMLTGFVRIFGYCRIKPFSFHI